MPDTQEVIGSSPIIPTEVNNNMVVEDKSKVIDVVIKYPDMMSDDAKDKIINMYNEILSLKSKLSNTRMACIELEDDIKAKEKDFRNMSNMFDLVFATRSVKVIQGECNTLIINPEDARNE